LDFAHGSFVAADAYADGDDDECVLQDCWYRTLERIMHPAKPAAEIVKRYEVTQVYPFCDTPFKLLKTLTICCRAQ
jgi:hypothetical protein